MRATIARMASGGLWKGSKRAGAIDGTPVRTRAPSARRAEGMRVYRALRDAIIYGKLAPGARLVEDQLAIRFRVSRTPVRDAIQRLQQEGYVVTPPGFRHARAVVAPLTQADAEELCSLAGCLEGFAAAAAARLPTHLRLELAGELVALNDALRILGDRPEPSRDKLHDLDAAFHHACTLAAAGPRLLALLEVVKPQAERYNQLYANVLPKRISATVAEHEAIIRCIRAGDADGARMAVEANYGHGTSQLTTAMTPATLRPRERKKGREAKGEK